MKKSTIISIRTAYVLIIVSLVLLALPAIIPPRTSSSRDACIHNLRLIDASARQDEPERNQLGWPVQKLSPEKERQNWERAMVALRKATRDQEDKIATLRAALGSAADPQAATQEVQHQEKILAALKKRVAEEEADNRVAGD